MPLFLSPGNDSFHRFGRNAGLYEYRLDFVLYEVIPQFTDILGAVFSRRTDALQPHNLHSVRIAKISESIMRRNQYPAGFRNFVNFLLNLSIERIQLLNVCLCVLPVQLRVFRIVFS
ncbi:hypothetical protein D3C77_351220 [compost metagenome]